VQAAELKGVIEMVEEAVRTHILIPRDLVEAIDRIAGRRKRSEFIVAALRQKLINERQKEALEKSIGALKDVDIPEWETPEETSQWVHDMRAADDRHRQAKLSRSLG
jgi:metal-responsive CopG/Arc/MetJ family transcriptional regulator